MDRLLALFLLGGLLAGVLTAGGAMASLTDDTEAHSFLSADPELAEDHVDPGETVVVDVELFDYGDNYESVSLALAVDGTPVHNETVSLAEEGSVRLEWVTPTEPTVADLHLEVSVENRTSIEPVGLVTVGEPDVDTLELEVPNWLLADDLTEFFWSGEKGIEATIDGETYDVEAIADITADGESIDSVDAWEAADPEDTVTIEAVALGASTEATVPVVDDPDDLDVTLEEEPVYAGQEVGFWIGPAGTTESLHAPRLDTSNDTVATVEDPPRENGEPTGPPSLKAGAPGETNITVGGPTVLVEPLTFPVTVEPSPPELEIEPGTDELGVGETTSVGVYATQPDGEIEEVTLPVQLDIANESVLGYEDGKLVGLEPGETVLTAAYEWQEATTMVVVEESPDGLSGPAFPVVAMAVLVGALAVWLRA